MAKRTRGTPDDAPRPSDPNSWLRFVHGSAFATKWARLGLGDDDLMRLENLIMVAPEGNPVVPGAGGLRKVRLADPKGGRGKSGSFRVYYAYFEGFGIVLLAAAFAKNEMSDLREPARKVMAGIVREIAAKLESGEIR